MIRQKRPALVLTFDSTAQAIAAETLFAQRGLPGRMIPVPAQISAGCGLAWRMTPEDWEHWNSLLDPAAYDAVSQVEQ